MVKELITIDDTIYFLNELISIDPNAIKNLINARVLCNQQMADHPTVQVGRISDKTHKYNEKEPFRVGFIGILNGLFGTIPEGTHKGWGVITFICDEEGNLSKFVRTEET
jgi:hypothetical protein